MYTVPFIHINDRINSIEKKSHFNFEFSVISSFGESMIYDYHKKEGNNKIKKT